MSRFSIRNPYFIIVVCLALALIGATSLARMPVDLFLTINMPEVMVATFYSGMPPGDIETDITNPLERFFTLASGIDHMESRSLLGVSMIKVYFQPGTDADADVTELSNLALADLKRLPPGTLPPVVLTKGTRPSAVRRFFKSSAPSTTRSNFTSGAGSRSKMMRSGESGSFLALPQGWISVTACCTSATRPAALSTPRKGCVSPLTFSASIGTAVPSSL